MGMQISTDRPSSTREMHGDGVRHAQRQEQRKALASALQAGDLDAAKTAYAALAAGNKRLERHPDSPLAQVGKALQAGDLAGAQKLFAEMASRHAHRGEHDDHVERTRTPPTPKPPEPKEPPEVEDHPPAASGSGSIGTLVNLVA